MEPSINSISLYLIIFLIPWTTQNVLNAQKNFEFYWNIPTFMCKKYNINTENLTEEIGILQNENDNFRGNKIAILYDPGKFPAILEYPNTKETEYFYRNKGVPQEGNLKDHLKEFERHLNEYIPDENFNGLAVIDFESWRPIYRQNFGALKPYKELSMYLEKKLHPKFTHKQLENEAKKRFEKAGRIFMEETILLAKKLRPYAKWGYYAFPYCFNGRNGNSPELCAAGITEENNKISWLFNSSDIILPSVYLSESISPSNRISMVRGRVIEGMRLAKNVQNLNLKPKTYVYHRYVYTDTLKFLPELETFEIFNSIKSLNADGVILWGSSNDLNSREKCKNFMMYLKDTLGPVINSLRDAYSVKASKFKD